MIDMTLCLFWRNASYYFQQSELGDGSHGVGSEGMSTLPRSSSSLLGGLGKSNFDLLSGKRSTSKDSANLYGTISQNTINNSLMGNRTLNNNNGTDLDINLLKEECSEFLRPTFVKLPNIDLVSIFLF
jgi:hypothetical protein